MTVRAAALLHVCAALHTPQRYLLLRHGQTDANAEGRIQGTSDFSRLTPLGEAQAAEAGAALAAALGDGRGVVRRTYVSPLTRAQQTLRAVGAAWPSAEAAGPVTLDALKEIELKEWSGRLKAEVEREAPERFAAWRSNPERFELDGGFRPVDALWERAFGVWREMRAAESAADSADGVTLVVAHNAINQALLCTACGLGAEHFRRVPWPNCGCVELLLDASPMASPPTWRWVVPGPGGTLPEPRWFSGDDIVAGAHTSEAAV